IKMTGITLYHIRRHFGRFNRALRLCCLKPSQEPQRVKLPDLLRDWAAIVRKLGRMPTISEYRSLGRHSDAPLRRRFRSWHHIGRGFREYVETHSRTMEWSDVIKIISSHMSSPRQVAILQKPRKARLMLDRPVYGRVMHRCQLAHAPVNEQ